MLKKKLFHRGKENKIEGIKTSTLKIEHYLLLSDSVEPKFVTIN